MGRRVVLDALASLESEGIEYCVLRNYGFVHGQPVAGDIDILIRESQSEATTRVLTAAGFREMEGDTSHQTRFHKFLPAQPEMLTLDLYWNEPTYNGLPILDGELTLTNRTRYPVDSSETAQIFVPRAEELFVELVFHGALNKNQYRDSYREELSQLRTTVSESTVLDHGDTLFGETGRQAIRHALSDDLAAVTGMKWQLIRAGCRRQPSKLPTLGWNLIVLRKFLRPLRSVRNRLPDRPAPVIALLGPDGSGKSTTARELEIALEKASIDTHVYELGVYNDSTILMDIAKRVRNTLSNARPENTDSTVKRSIGTRRSPVEAAVHLIDIGIRTLDARSGEAVVIADRYAHDILLYDEPGPLNRIVPWFERPPFLGIILAGPSEAIAERSEYDETSIETMYDRLAPLAFERIDATEETDVIVQRLLERIAETDIPYSQ